MPRHTSLNTTLYMKPSNYLAVIISISAIWILLDIKSPAQSVKLKPPLLKPTLLKLASPQQSLLQPKIPSDLSAVNLLAQNLEPSLPDSNVSKDFMLQDITITQNSLDKSLLTVTGFINNRSSQSHYVYYIVAKFISNDTAIKQTIIPVNIELEAGQSKPFTHEISTDGVNAISPETVKPLVVKYEYR